MVEDVVVLQLAVPVVVEVHANLLPRVYSVPPQHWRGACRYPDAGQRVGVHFVLLDQSLSLLVHVDTSMLTVVDLVVSHYRITVCTDLYAGQCVTCGANPFTDSLMGSNIDNKFIKIKKP